MDWTDLVKAGIVLYALWLFFVWLGLVWVLLLLGVLWVLDTLRLKPK